MGATPPHDHPHVYLDMGHEAHIVCPYCSTLVPARPRAQSDGERPALLHLRRDRPARRAGGLKPLRMAKRGDRVLIAGGGIGGLAAAIALGRRGIESEILERSRFRRRERRRHPARSQRHAGPAHAWRPRCYRATRFRPEAIVIYDGVAGRRLASMPLGKARRDAVWRPLPHAASSRPPRRASRRGRRPCPGGADARLRGDGDRIAGRRGAWREPLAARGQRARA